MKIIQKSYWKSHRNLS